MARAVVVDYLPAALALALLALTACGRWYVGPRSYVTARPAAECHEHACDGAAVTVRLTTDRIP